MADTYEKDLAQKSTLTTSDYIRVVGSDNVSYKQLVSAVMTAMGLDALKNPAKTVSNIDTATATGFYGYTSAASGTKPIADSGGDLIVIAHSSTYSVQVAIPYSTTNANNIYKRVIVSGTPTEWQLQPTRAEVDALSAFALTYRGTLTSADDCNTLTQGVYVFNASIPQNAPSNVSYGTFIVVSGTYGTSIYNFQLLSTAGRGLYYRRKQGQPSDGFSAWTKVTGTQV